MFSRVFLYLCFWVLKPSNPFYLWISYLSLEWLLIRITLLLKSDEAIRLWCILLHFLLWVILYSIKYINHLCLPFYIINLNGFHQRQNYDENQWSANFLWFQFLFIEHEILIKFCLEFDHLTKVKIKFTKFY